MGDDKNWCGWRAPFSAVVGIGWLIFIIIFLAFYAYPSYERNFSVFLLSILVLFLLLGGVWAIWSFKMIPKEGWDLLKFKGFKWRLIVSIIIPLAAMIFLIVWFWETAIPYTIWQNIAVFLVVILIMAAILSVIWIGWGKKYGDIFEKQAEEVGMEIEKKFKDKE